MVAELILAGETEYLIASGLPATILPERESRRRVAVLTQPGASDHASRVARLIEKSGYDVEMIGLPDRDDAKTLEVAKSVYESFARFGLGRQDTVVGVGGGAVSDVSGFVAGTWMRGVEVVHVPTTLLGAVDAAIGGKAGVNLGGKNLVGVFWHPSRVVVDADILDGLPATLIRDGLCEALKMGLVGDPDLFEMLERDGAEASLQEVVRLAVAVKSGVVVADEREQGPRAFLNLGHTFGHAVEFASTLTHGESIGPGMVAAARISELRLGFDDAARVNRAIAGLGISLRVPNLDAARIRDLLRHDKKRDADGLRMVLLAAIGQPQLVHISEADVDAGLDAIGL